MNDTKSATANFTALTPPICYTLTTNANPAGGGSVNVNPAPDCNEGTQYTSGTIVQLTANANGGYIFNNWSGNASGSLNPVFVTMNGTKSATANFSILNTTVTIDSATGWGPITLTTYTQGCSFFNVGVKTEEQTGNDPAFDYPYGLVEFSLNCTAADVTITFPGSISGTTYRKYGPTTPGNAVTTTWYTFNNVTVNSSTSITLHLTDGQLGDDTGVDGIIVDQGGPGLPTGSDAVSVPTMNEWGMIIFIALSAFGAVFYMRRRPGSYF
jgi:hypothetical protein